MSKKFQDNKTLYFINNHSDKIKCLNDSVKILKWEGDKMVENFKAIEVI